MREDAGIELPPLRRAATNYEGQLAATRAELGEGAFEKAWEEGRAITVEQAVRYALSEEEPAPSAPQESPADKGAGELTRRDLLLAALMAQELTNRQIASKLFISERTVATHLGRIFKKLKVHSREQVAELFTEPRQAQDYA
jgi:non-specific serine/threonine protein kinase